MSVQLLKSTATVGGITLISRVFGFVRDMIAAHFFGASEGYDAFIVASKIPNFFRRLFAEGAFSQAFVPLLSEYRISRSPEEIHTFINRVAGCLALVLSLVTLLGILMAPLLILLFAPGFVTSETSMSTTHPANRFELASTLLRITFPYLLLVSLTAFSGSILNAYGKFAVPALTPVFLNIAMILATILLAPYLSQPIQALAWGMFAGGLIQLLFQWPFLYKLRLLPHLEFNWRDKGVRRIIALMIPALLGVSVNQLNLVSNSIFASFLPIGSVSWLYYAERLMEFPLGGFGVALATVVLPRLSQQHASAEQQAFSETLDWGLRWVMLVGLPAALGLGLLAGPLLTTLFQSGNFTQHDVLMSQPCLIAYSIGILGFMCVKIFASAYYAKQDIKTPVQFATITVAANLIFSTIMVLPFAQMGLALATSCAALLNAFLLGFRLWRKKDYILQPGWSLLALQLLLACMALSAVILFFSPSLETWFVYGTLERIKTLIFLIVSAGIAYIATLLATGLRIRHVLA